MNYPRNNGAAVAVSNKALMDLKSAIERRRDSLAAVASKHLKPERLIKLAIVGASRNPSLLTCSHESIIKALMEASECGLEPFSALNLAYVVPYKNGRTGVSEAQFIPSYRGLIDIARRSGQIKTIEAKIIYERDKYEVEEGLNPKLIHIPCLDGKDRGKEIIIYAIARLKDGGVQYEIMTVSDIEKIRSKSRAPNNGPWVDHWGAMAKKTCLKQLCKLLPTSPELSRYIEKDNDMEAGNEIIDYGFLEKASTHEIIESHAVDTPSKAESLLERLAGVTGTQEGGE